MRSSGASPSPGDTVCAMRESRPGGDTRLLGDRLGQPWMVGIQNPRNEEEVAVTIPLEDEAISTSGRLREILHGRWRAISSHHRARRRERRQARCARRRSSGRMRSLPTRCPHRCSSWASTRALRLIGALPDYEGIVIDAEGEMFIRMVCDPLIRLKLFSPESGFHATIPVAERRRFFPLNSKIYGYYRTLKTSP